MQRTHRHDRRDRIRAVVPSVRDQDLQHTTSDQCRPEFYLLWSARLPTHLASRFFANLHRHSVQPLFRQDRHTRRASSESELRVAVEICPNNAASRELLQDRIGDKTSHSCPLINLGSTGWRSLRAPGQLRRTTRLAGSGCRRLRCPNHSTPGSRRQRATQRLRICRSLLAQITSGAGGSMISQWLLGVFSAVYSIRIADRSLP